MKDFWHTLFNDGEGTCFAVHAKGTKVFPISTAPQAQQWANFYSINPLLEIDTCPTEEWHCATTPRRADANVSAYRNFLLESDSLTIEEQALMVMKIGLPYTAATFSGSKSIHWVVSLSEDLKTRKEYDDLAQRLHRACNRACPGFFDQSTKNPSRLSRFPDAIRNDTGAKQELIELKDRVALADLQQWIARYVPPENKHHKMMLEHTKIKPIQFANSNRKPNPFTRNFLGGVGICEGNRNNQLFKAAIDLINCGWTEEQIYSKVKLILVGMSEREIKSTIGSAAKRKA